MSPLSDTERAALLALALAAATSRGWRVESLTPFDAVLVSGHHANHVAHLLAVILTCGLWLPVWAVAAACSGERRRSVWITPYGEFILR